MAAETMKITAKDLLELNVIDEVITEPQGGAHKDIVFKQNKLNNPLFISLMN